jgi:uncharacterized protein YndB with AHSA1/START domain
MELPGDREIVITRAFNATARVVFEAWTLPELVRRWWAPKSHGVSVTGCEADVRAGGHYRYVLRLPNGGEFAFAGRYLEVVPPTRLVYTQLFEPTAAGEQPGDVPITITVTFEERDGKTYLRSHTVCPSAEVREAILSSGMEHGMRETMDQLEELVSPTRLSVP